MSDFEQLVRASRLYYELGENQNQVAALLGVTRPQVSRLLKRARAEGIVEIRIIDTTSVDNAALALEGRGFFISKVGTDGFKVYHKATIRKAVSDRRASLDEETEVRPAMRALVRKEIYQARDLVTVEKRA